MTLRLGSEGSEVAQLQGYLKTLGYYQHVVDGSFGRWTREAVLAFQEHYFVDGIGDIGTLKAAEEAANAWDNREIEILVPVPSGLAEIERQFGEIEFTDLLGGYIRITNDFEHHIVAHDFPVVGRQLFHEKLVPVLERVLDDIRAKGLDGEIIQFGTFCPRHKMHDIIRGLSMHSYGIAVDVNQATNMPGIRGDLDLGIVGSFERFGFQWGGRWRDNLDWMHFEYTKS